MSRLEARIDGMTCDGCARRVREAFERAGAEHVEVDWQGASARLDPKCASEADLRDALSDSSYRLTGLRELDGPSDRDGACDVELLIIGSGGGAFAGAIRARELGRSVLMVEHATTGGTCVNIGCIPSKAMLVDAAAAHGDADRMRSAQQRKRALVARLRADKYEHLVEEYGFELRHGRAELIGPHTVAIDGEPVRAQSILIAAGARPAGPAIPGLRDAGYLTSTTALELERLPARIAVLGTGPVGLELGQMLGDFGAQVTFIARRCLAPNTEPEIADVMRRVFGDAGHTVLERHTTETVAVEGSEKVLRGRDATGKPFELHVDELLVATGRTPNTDGLGLERVGVQTDERGHILVDAEQRTSAAGIFAVGDCTQQPQYVYVAASGGAAAADNALGQGGRRLNFEALPRIIFTEPAIASAGLTEAAARDAGRDVDSRVLPLDVVPRALVNADTRGLVKLIAETGSGRLLGATIVATGAGDIVLAATLAIERGMTVTELGATWAPYLTMAESLRLAAQMFNRDVSKLSCCAA
ncbi:MAG: mercury(II) reductase [Solirubrobacteraceae bacterium]